SCKAVAKSSRTWGTSWCSNSALRTVRGSAMLMVGPPCRDAVSVQEPPYPREALLAIPLAAATPIKQTNYVVAEGRLRPKSWPDCKPLHAVVETISRQVFLNLVPLFFYPSARKSPLGHGLRTVPLDPTAGLLFPASAGDLRSGQAAEHGLAPSCLIKRP